MAHQIYEGLVAYQARADGAYTTVPCLAESWTANGDATVWTFRLRRGVMFQAPVGREVTARDVVADFRFGADPAQRCRHRVQVRHACRDGPTTARSRSPGRAGCEAIDRYTVRFTLKSPYAAFPDTLGRPWAWVWPVDYLRRVGRERFDQQPVGTGPFVLSHWVRGSRSTSSATRAGGTRRPGSRTWTRPLPVFKSVSAQLAFQRGRSTTPRFRRGRWRPPGRCRR